MCLVHFKSPWVHGHKIVFKKLPSEIVVYDLSQ